MKKQYYFIFAAIMAVSAVMLFLFVPVYRFTAFGFFIIAGILFLAGLFQKKNEQAYQMFGLIVGIGVIMLTILTSLIASGGQSDNREADYAIVLGAAVVGETPSRVLADRLESAITYAKSYPDAKIIVSGGQGVGETVSEAEAMRLYLESRGISPERIIVEDRSGNTRENISFSKQLIDGRESDPYTVAIITNEFHLYRAKWIAKKLGMETIGISVSTYPWPLRMNYYFREIFSMLYQWLIAN